MKQLRIILPLFIFLILIDGKLKAQYPNEQIKVEEKYCSNDKFIGDLAFASTGSIYGVGTQMDSIGNDGQVQDAIFVKFNQDFDTLFIKNIGGTARDEFFSIIRIDDNRFLVSGWTQSVDGDVNHLYPSTAPIQPTYWLTILDSMGNILHQTMYGYGSGVCKILDMNVNKHGQIFVAGDYQGPGSGDFAAGTAPFLTTNPWVAMLDSQLNKKWLEMYSCDFGWVQSISSDTSGNAVASIIAKGDTGVFAEPPPLGLSDIIIFRIDTSGQIQSKKRIGGSNIDGVTQVDIDEDNKMYIMAYGCFTDGDFYLDTPNKTHIYHFLTYESSDSNAQLLRDIPIGSFEFHTEPSTQNPPKYLLLPKGEVWMGSSIAGKDQHYWGDAISYLGNSGIGSYDQWYCHFDSTGHWDSKIRWGCGGKFSDNSDEQRARRGFRRDPFTDKIYSLIWTANVDRVKNDCSCDTNSIKDFYKILEVSQWPLGIDEITKDASKVKVYPNPFESTIRIEIIEEEGPYQIQVLDMSGREIWKGHGNEKIREISIGRQAEGAYLLKIIWNKSQKQYSQKIIYSP